MRNQTILLSFLVSLTASGCNQLECADGTIERDGVCQPDDGVFGKATCGEFTELIGDRCVPMFPPTECDPGSTEAVTDPETGVTTCKGTGTVGVTCATPPNASKQSVCGQIYNFEDGTKFEADTECTPCDPANPAADGPCSLKIMAFNALNFAAGSGGPLPGVEVKIDTCGKYAVSNIDAAAAGTFIGLGFDDATATTLPHPGGVTVTSAVAVKTVGGTATRDVEAFVVPQATAAGWTGATLQTGVYAAIYRASKTGFANQAGVKISRGGTQAGNEIPSNDFYFAPDATTRTTITADNETGVNGTAFVNNATVDMLYYGRGGLGAGCMWEPHAAASLPGVLFVQVFRKVNLPGETCAD